jgi:hypothetical protein
LPELAIFNVNIESRGTNRIVKVEHTQCSEWRNHEQTALVVRDVLSRPTSFDGVAFRLVEHGSICAHRFRLGTVPFPVAGLFSVVGGITVRLRLKCSGRRKKNGFVKARHIADKPWRQNSETYRTHDGKIA